MDAACRMAAFSRLIFSSLVFVLLLVGSANVDVIPAAVLAACTGWRQQAQSPLRRSGIRLRSFATAAKRQR